MLSKITVYKLQDIVVESTFDLDGFIPLLRERIYTQNSFARQFVISWISILNTEPGLDLIVYLPDILDGLFIILDDPKLEVRKMCETTLGEFLRCIKSDPTRVNFSGMINILNKHAQEKSDLVQVSVFCIIIYFIFFKYTLVGNKCMEQLKTNINKLFTLVSVLRQTSY